MFSLIYESAIRITIKIDLNYIWGDVNKQNNVYEPEHHFECDQIIPNQIANLSHIIQNNLSAKYVEDRITDIIWVFTE